MAPSLKTRPFCVGGRTLEADTLDDLLRDWLERYRAAVSSDHPVAPDTIAFVRTVAASVPVAIDEVKVGKPHPETFTTAR